MTDYDTHNDNLGVMMTFNPVWGGVEDTDSNSNWFESLVNDQFGESPRTIGTRIESELGYGFNIGTETDRLTPFGGVEYASSSHRKYRIGLRLNLGSNFNFELGFAESNSFASGTSHELTTNGSLYWKRDGVTQLRNGICERSLTVEPYRYTWWRVLV